MQGSLAGAFTSAFGCAPERKPPAVRRRSSLQSGLVGQRKLRLGNLLYTAPYQLVSKGQGVGDEGGAGSTGDDEHQLVIVLADAGAIAVAGGLEAAAGGEGS